MRGLLAVSLFGLARAQLLDLVEINGTPPSFVTPSLDVATQKATYSTVTVLKTQTGS